MPPSPVWLQHVSPARQQYFTAKWYLYPNAEIELDWSDESVTFQDRALELVITDPLCRLAACGKQIESLEVVTIYNAWQRDVSDPAAPREPIYLVHFVGLSDETNPTYALDSSLAHSYSGFEISKHHASPTHVGLARPAEGHISLDVEDDSKEICYSIFLLLKREDTHFVPAYLLSNTQQQQLDRLAQDRRISNMKTSYPVPCFGEDGCRLLLHGFFNGDVAAMSVRLNNWKVDGDSYPRAESLVSFIEENSFLFVDDGCFEDGTLEMTDQWRDAQPLKDLEASSALLKNIWSVELVCEQWPNYGSLLAWAKDIDNKNE